MPTQVDSNSPAYWKDGQLHLLNSTGGNNPAISTGSDQFHLGAPVSVRWATRVNQWPMWIEATWVDPTSGYIYAWYHAEHFGICPGGSRLSAPQIGAAVSWDGGDSFYDLGTILSSGDPINCASQNGYFAGGNGDFSVILDRERKYFYFLFTNYAGPTASQGVSIARMAFEFRAYPQGMVWKYYQGWWGEPGVGGHETPIFPAKVSWQKANTNSMWGPSVHWNTYLNSYVVLLNHSCCTSGFPQEGIYASFSSDLSDPSSWAKPVKILQDGGWYPQVLGTGPQGTDRQAGRVTRLYIYGHSHWEIVFLKPAEPDPQPQQ